MKMRCFARWEQDNTQGLFFRDQTILQFGNSWDLLASLVLLNPGSAIPLNEIDQTEMLVSKNLPFFVVPKGDEKYVEFTIDRLMCDVLKLFAEQYTGGGTIRLYNLFNLQNQYSGQAVKELEGNQNHAKMFAKDSDIHFADAAVIIACGCQSKKIVRLKEELKRYVSIANPEQLYKIAKCDQHNFSMVKAQPDQSGFIDSYHPSYTFKYGNNTELGDLSSTKV
jgi:hypothetical protein